MKLNVYLSGEIHTDWREQIIKGCKEDYKSNKSKVSFKRLRKINGNE